MNSYAICSLDLYTNGVEDDFEECFDFPKGWKSKLGPIEYLRLSGLYSRQELWKYSKYVPDKRLEKLG